MALRVGSEITCYSWCQDLGRIGLRQLSETAGVAALRRGFRDCGAVQDGLKIGAKNSKLFLTRP